MFVGKKRLLAYHKALKRTGCHKLALAAALKEPSENEREFHAQLDALKETKNFIDMRKKRTSMNLLNFT